MPTTINPVITDAGLSAAINANANGVQLAITHVVLGSGKYTPTNASTIQSRKEKASIAGGYKVGDNGFRVNVLFSSYTGATYDASEIGFYAGDPDAGGVLFAVFSHPSSVIVQRNALDYVAQYGMTVNRVPTGSVTVTVDPSASQALALIAAHEGAADPHTQYAKKTDVNAALQSMASAVANAGGTANAITAAFSQPITSLTNGTNVLVKASTANTSASVTFKADALNTLPVVKAGNAALEVGDIVGSGHWMDLVYDASLNKWILQNPATGINVAALFTGGANQSLASNGWQKLPGGFIIQWGTVPYSGTGFTTVTLPISFSTAILMVGTTKRQGHWTPVANVNGSSLSSIIVGCTDGVASATDPAFWFAWGK
jgi:hypothetical protein